MSLPSHTRTRFSPPEETDTTENKQILISDINKEREKNRDEINEKKKKKKDGTIRR